MKGCGVLVCPGTKFCSQLQSFVLAAQNVAGTGGSGEGWILSRLGEKRLRAGLFCLYILEMMNGQGSYIEGDQPGS